MTTNTSSYETSYNDHLVPKPSTIPITPQLKQQLKIKYEYERDLRLNARPEGNEQYINIQDLAEQGDSRFQQMLSNPYPKAQEAPNPHPLTDEMYVTVIGGGYGGLCAAARLVESGVPSNNIRVLDSGNDVGGTWYWNRYPGAMCDIESYVYMPLCEEMNYIPTEKYAHQPEIYSHCQAIMKKYKLYEKACFGGRVIGLKWLEERGQWCIKTTLNDKFYSQFVIMNFGLFTQPKLPKFQTRNISSFKGHMFHTSRWDYEYTGGNSQGHLINLQNKKVGIIGTGATAIQVIPHLGKYCQELYVFQRTPSPVDVRNNCQTTSDYANKYLKKKGWQNERQQNFIEMVQTFKGSTLGVDLVNDGWTEIIRSLLMASGPYLKKVMYQAVKDGVDITDPEFRKKIARGAMNISLDAQYQQMEKIRTRCELVVENKETANSLKPWYHQFCKRPCFHDDYLVTFNRPNVHLIDTHGKCSSIVICVT